MSDASEPTSTPQGPPSGGRAPAGRAADGASTPADPSTSADSSTPADSDAASEDAASDDEAPSKLTSLREFEQPTRRIARVPIRKRTPEDDVITAAVITIDLKAEVSPLSEFLGTTLVFRAARLAGQLGIRHVILWGDVPADQEALLLEQATQGLSTSPGATVRVERGLLHAESVAERGRVLILDGSALHDEAGLRSLARTLGDRTIMLLSKVGDGLRVRVEGQLLREYGLELLPYDGRFAGACLVPLEDFEELTRGGETAAMEQFMASERLVGLLERDTVGQQFSRKDHARVAQKTQFKHLAGGARHGLFQDVLGRFPSRALTRRLLRTRISSTGITLFSALLALVGAGCLIAPSPWVAVGAGLLLVASAVLDQTDGELARLRLEPDAARSRLDFGLDHLVHMAVFVALAFGVQETNEFQHTLTQAPVLDRLKYAAEASLGRPITRPAILLGVIAASGVAFLGAVQILRGVPTGKGSFPRRVGDFLATGFGSRDIFYVVLFAALIRLLAPEAGLLGLVLVLSAALIHLLWIVLLITTIVAPKPPEE